MVCRLPVPYWTTPTQKGLLSAVENVVDGYIVLDIAEALPVEPGEFVYYNLYWSSDVNTLYDAPKAVTTKVQVSIPGDIASIDYYFAVRVAQLGISGLISSDNLTLIAANVYSYPSEELLKAPLTVSSTHIVIEDATGWPLTDGYVLVEEEVILYSSVIPGYGGFDGLVIQERDPFGCNDVVVHADGYNVSLYVGFEDLNPRQFKALASCGMPEPEWESLSNKGIKRVSDLGIGTSAKVEWFDAKPPLGFSRAYFNVYQSTGLLNLFNSQPIGVSTSLEAISPSLTPGKSYYFGVRAAYQLSNLDLVNFGQISDNFYDYPAAVNIDEDDGYFFTTQLETLTVDTTDGFPLNGYIGVGSEILEYDSKTSTSFNIVDRDLFTLGLATNYPNGTKVNFFKGIEDRNSQFYRVVPSWDGGAEVPWMPVPDGYLDGLVDLNYNQDSDGYRYVFDDIVTEDLSAFEDDNSDFDQFNYCGYRNSNPVNLHQGAQCGTYQGGRGYGAVPGSSGSVPIAGGLNIWESAQQRSEVILGLTAEPFVLIRRKTTGRKCPRLSIRSEHPNSRCGTCFGTTFLGGYDKFTNVRELQPGIDNVNGFLNIRVSPYDNDLELTSDRGLAQTDILEGWTIAVPIIKDRDILVKFIFDEGAGVYIEDYRYEVLKVTRNKLFFGKSGQQKMTMKKLNKDDEIYTYPVVTV